MVTTTIKELNRCCRESGATVHGYVPYTGQTKVAPWYLADLQRQGKVFVRVSVFPRVGKGKVSRPYYGVLVVERKNLKPTEPKGTPRRNDGWRG